MKVCHVYSQDNPQLARYVSLLCDAMPPDVECMSEGNGSCSVVSGSSADIIHLHGQAACKLPKGARLVVSPHGETDGDSRAYATIARSQLEARRLHTERIEVVQNPLVTKTTDFQQAASHIAAIYRRVLDSNPLERMDADTRQALATLLNAGLTPQLSIANCQLSITNFHLLYIYAEQESVLPLVLAGMKAMGVQAPPKSPTDNYLPSGYQRPTSMAGKSIAAMLRDLQQNGPTLLRLADLHRALHDDLLDEERLMDTLKAEKLLPLMQAALQLLSEQTLLEEGFMPCQPVDNAMARQLRKALADHLRL